MLFTKAFSFFGAINAGKPDFHHLEIRLKDSDYVGYEVGADGKEA